MSGSWGAVERIELWLPSLSKVTATEGDGMEGAQTSGERHMTLGGYHTRAAFMVRIRHAGVGVRLPVVFRSWCLSNQDAVGSAGTLCLVGPQTHTKARHGEAFPCAEVRNENGRGPCPPGGSA